MTLNAKRLSDMVILLSASARFFAAINQVMSSFVKAILIYRLRSVIRNPQLVLQALVDRLRHSVSIDAGAAFRVVC